MNEISEEICTKLGVNPNLVLKKCIRGLPGITQIQLVSALISSDTMESASQYLGYTLNPVKQAIRNSLAKYFPTRTRLFGVGGGHSSWRYALLASIEHKYCWHCKNIKRYADFSSDLDSSDILNGSCRSCHTYLSKEYKSYVRIRTPSWADLTKIKEMYANCPKGLHVDHIIPLKGELVSGLHVHNNLQYLPPEDNMQKGNRFEV